MMRQDLYLHCPLILGSSNNNWYGTSGGFRDTLISGIVGNDLRTSRIPPFGLRGENSAKRFSFSLRRK